MAAADDEVNPFLSRNQPPLNQRDTTTRFQGARAVVTGGASGIGRAVVERFLNDGAAAVAILDIDLKAGEAAVADLNEQGFSGRVHFRRADVSNLDDLRTAVSSFAREHAAGRIDHLVASAVHFVSHGVDGADSSFLSAFKVNVLGAIHAVQAALPFMRRGAAVVLLSSISAHRCQPQRWSYAATKGAVDVLTKDMALDLAGRGVRVNSVSPGFVWTPEQRKASPDGTRAAMRDVVAGCAFLGREGETSEVAAAVAFLCSKDAAFIDGADLPVDGGYLAMGPEGLGQKSVYAGHAGTE